MAVNLLILKLDLKKLGDLHVERYAGHAHHIFDRRRRVGHGALARRRVAPVVAARATTAGDAART